MKDLHTISSEKFANQVFGEIDENFSDIKSAVDILEQSGGGGGGGNTSGEQDGLPALQFKRMKTYKVLVLSNSFGTYPNYPFGQIANLLGLDVSTYGFNIFATAGASLADVLSKITGNSSTSVAIAYGDGKVATNVGYRTALTNDWDAVIFHQNSANAADYSTYSALTDLVNAVRTYCTNPRVKIGFQMIWDKYHGKSTTQREQILANAMAVMQDYEIDFIVPTGNAFELAWADSNASQKMALDPSGHPNNAFTEYLAGATWYQCLFSQLSGIDIDDYTPRDTMTWQGYTSSRSITPADAILAARLAKEAVDGMSSGGSSGGGGTETDPVFKASPAYGITNAKITEWNNKYTKPSGGIPASDLADGVIPNVNDKQDTLASGENIKTIDGQSVLGSGNIPINDALFGKMQNGEFLQGTYSTNGWAYNMNPVTPQVNKTYVDVVANTIYRYSGSAYVALGAASGGETYEAMSQAEVTAGTGTTARTITPKLLRDNLYTKSEVDNKLGQKADVPSLVEVTTSGAVSQALAPNTFYKFSGSLTSLTLTLTAGTGLVLYAGKFSTGSGWTSNGLSLPASVTEAAGNDEISASKTYEFSILDNVIVIKEV